MGFQRDSSLWPPEARNPGSYAAAQTLHRLNPFAAAHSNQWERGGLFYLNHIARAIPRRPVTERHGEAGLNAAALEKSSAKTDDFETPQGQERTGAVS